jgi:hypothetical protein
MHTIPIALTRPDPLDPAMPEIAGSPQIEALNFLCPLLIEEAKVHFLGVGREQGEIDAGARDSGAQRRGLSRENTRGRHS